MIEEQSFIKSTNMLMRHEDEHYLYYKVIIMNISRCHSIFARFSWKKKTIGYTLNNAGLFQHKFGSNMDKPKCWVKNVI